MYISCDTAHRHKVYTVFVGNYFNKTILLLK